MEIYNLNIFVFVIVFAIFGLLIINNFQAKFNEEITTSNNYDDNTPLFKLLYIIYHIFIGLSWRKNKQYSYLFSLILIFTLFIQISLYVFTNIEMAFTTSLLTLFLLFLLFANNIYILILNIILMCYITVEISEMYYTK